MKLFGIHIHRGSLSLALFDTFLCLIAFAIIELVNIKLGWFTDINIDDYGQRIWISAVLISMLIAVRIYARNTEQYVQRMSVRIPIAVFLSFVFLLLMQTLYGLFVGSPTSDIRAVMALLAFVGIFAYAGRMFASYLGLQHIAATSPSLVIGDGMRANRLRRALDAEQDQLLVGFLPSFGTSSELIAEAKAFGARRIVVAVDESRASLTTSLIVDCVLNGIEVIDDKDFVESINCRVDLETPRQLELAKALSQKRSLRYDWVKRGMDIVIALTLLLITLPLHVLSALAVVLDSRGPALFCQLRTGLGEKPFRLYKLRTMTNSPRHGFADQHEAAITRVGRILRRTRVDELPQLFNVLKGDMSIVGPRPEQAGEEHAGLFAKHIRSYSLRHVVKPGLTGWAQINQGYCGNSMDDHRIKASYDLFYIKNRSTMFDLYISAQTLSVLLFGGDKVEMASNTAAHQLSPR